MTRTHWTRLRAYLAKELTRLNADLPHAQTAECRALVLGASETIRAVQGRMSKIHSWQQSGTTTRTRMRRQRAVMARAAKKVA